MFSPKRIILHHSATEDSGTVSWLAIRDYHIRVKEWSDIGYHFGIERIMDDYGRSGIEILFGRLLTEAGAHAYGYNHDSIGICFVGNYDVVIPNIGMLKHGVRLVNWLRQVYSIPISSIIGHRDVSDKTCPGKLFDIKMFQNMVRVGEV